MDAMTTSRPDAATRRPDGGPILPEVEMHLLAPASPGTATVVENRVCTSPKAAHVIRHVALDVSETPLAGRFRAGQSFGVIPPGVDERGLPHKVRLYSIAAPSRGEDGAGRVVSTTVKRLITEHWETHRLFLGVSSNYLCDLQPGDRVTVTGPSGKRFLAPANPHEYDYIFFSTGTGIAPFRGMVADLFGAGATSKIMLVHGSPYGTDVPYYDEFVAIERMHPNFRYLTAISRETAAGEAGPLYVQGRLRTHRDLLMPMLESPRTLVYVCGIAGMELGIFQELARILPPTVLEQYLRMDPALLGDIGAWERRMIPREIRPTKRVMMEVY
jgi:ferredoxin--NADP+ reductase